MSKDYDEEIDESWISSISQRIATVVHVFHKPWMPTLILALVVVSGAMIAWRKFGPEILQNPKFFLNLDRLEVTKQPAWIHTDVKADVVRDSRLDELSLQDKRLIQKVGDAFAVHTWVAQVQRVRKYPDKVVVQLKYRRPIAMVEVTDSRGAGLIFVDAHGVVLPTSDFSPDQTQDFLRIVVPDVKPQRLAGIAWRDDRVHSAAKIAEAWGKQWKKAGLYRIVAMDRAQRAWSSEDAEFEFHTRKGSRIIWGQAIGQERTGEANAPLKIAALIEYVEQNGPLEQADHPVYLDIRNGRVTPTTPKSAFMPTSG